MINLGGVEEATRTSDPRRGGGEQRSLVRGTAWRDERVYFDSSLQHVGREMREREVWRLAWPMAVAVCLGREREPEVRYRCVFYLGVEIAVANECLTQVCDGRLHTRLLKGLTGRSYCGNVHCL